MDCTEDSCHDKSLEPFSLEGSGLDNETEPICNQRTSTPTKNMSLLHSEVLVTTNGQVSNQEAVLSPVLNSGCQSNTQTHDQDQESFSQEQSFHSLREYSTQENSREESQSLYTSASSNINDTVIADSFSAEKENILHLPKKETLHQVTFSPENLSKTSAEDNSWATAQGSFQDDPDVEDVTLKQEPSYLSEESFDESVDHSFQEKDIVKRSGDFMQDLNDSTYKEIAFAFMNDQNLQYEKNGAKEIAEGTNHAEDMDSPDLELLNEICEEATNMTIKEALIFSLNPGVRAGLREGRLSLNESEILALEQYCETFIDNLISELLDGQWSERINSEIHEQVLLDSKVLVAKKLSNLDLETLKLNCDRFVRSVITESLHDASFAIHTRDTKPTEINGGEKMSSLDQNTIQELLPIFKKSTAIQDYIGFLSADIVKSALAKLSTSESIATNNDEKNGQLTLNNNSTSHIRTGAEEAGDSSECEEALFDEKTKTDLRKSQGKYTNSGDQGDKTRTDIAPIGIDDNYEPHYEGEREELSDNEQIFSSSVGGALETSLEFDPDGGMWDEGEMFTNLNSLDAEKHFSDNQRQRSYSAPKKITHLFQTDIRTEEENSDNAEDSETEVEEQEYEGDESETENADEQDDDETRVEEGILSKAQLEADSSDENRFRWHTVSVHGRDKILDLKLLEPYMKVISHGGYFSDTKSTIVVIAACYLPEKTIKNYDFLMEQLFFYVISTLELLAIHEDYYLVYLNGGTRQQNMPSVTWMKRFYQYIEGGLKKMKEMFIVHPSFRLKAVITLAKPLINANFWRKLSFISTLSTLSTLVPVDYIYIPDEVMRVDPTYRQVHNR
ncbi:hypothetical protein pdam_00014498 [Pocillopora damicornis]|uniref:CRAL-TRIO domain-containing protein n=1 Tax=Pocillopora damicornis TaxID=46731 RepID=A0A3M6U095_POCDA|nr:hypothetical protein pdam_00014498 [Pocillopora damicornis]